LQDAVRLRCDADVPVGAFLSGGIDSAGIVALMAAQAAGPVRAFTAGFREPAFDETSRAAAIADQLGVRHHELVVTSGDALAALVDLPGANDEPFADAAQIPTLLLSRLARQYVKVVQTGEGSDEVFGGYPQYRLAAAHAAGNVAAAGNWPDPLPSLDAHLNRAMWRDTRGLVPDAADPFARLDAVLETTDLGRSPADLILGDTLTWLPDNSMVKVDRATMATGLEARCPYLDHRIMELTYRMPMDLKVRPDAEKIILRRVLARHLPDVVCRREKWGFTLPLSDWLRGPLRAWAEDLFDDLAHGPIAVEPVRERWRRHLAGCDDHTEEIWTVLMFQVWARDRATRGRCASERV
jgi:asparagine synthase (glutamine-hydrolysing)